MTVQSKPSSFEMRDYLNILRRRWWIVIGVVCLVSLAAAVYTLKSTKTYSATSTVYVNSNAANATQLAGGRTSGAINMDNEAQIVKSAAVGTLVAKDMHSTTSVAGLIAGIDVTVPANTTVLQISCSAHTAKGSAACAQDFANAYLANRQATAQNKINSEIKQEQARATPLEAQAVALQHKISTLRSDSPELATDHAALADVSSELAPLRSAIASLGASTNYSAGYIITGAVPPTSPSSPKKRLYLPSGVMAGLLIGLIAAFVVDRRDDRIHSASDVQRIFDVPVLFRPFSKKKHGLPLALVPSRSRTGCAFTELAQTVATALGDGNHVILVASTSPGPSVSVVAANLAATLARIRADVILVCADLQYSASPQILGVPDGPGLAEVIAGTATIGEVPRQAAEVPRLRVITPGVDTAAALSQVQYDASRRMVASMREDARYVVIEAEGTAHGADTLSFAEFADAAIAVAEVGTTRQNEIADCIMRLDRLRTEVLGAVVVPALDHASQPVAQPSTPPQEPRLVHRDPLQERPAKKEWREAQPRRAEPGQTQRQGGALPANRTPGETRPRKPVSAAPEEIGESARADLPAADRGSRGI